MSDYRLECAAGRSTLCARLGWATEEASVLTEAGQHVPPNLLLPDLSCHTGNFLDFIGTSGVFKDTVPDIDRNEFNEQFGTLTGILHGPSPLSLSHAVQLPDSWHVDSGERSTL